jgi:hypothetical protein
VIRFNWVDQKPEYILGQKAAVEIGLVSLGTNGALTEIDQRILSATKPVVLVRLSSKTGGSRYLHPTCETNKCWRFQADFDVPDDEPFDEAEVSAACELGELEIESLFQKVPIVRPSADKEAR